MQCGVGKTIPRVQVCKRLLFKFSEKCYLVAFLLNQNLMFHINISMPYVCFNGVLRPTQEYFTHTETSPIVGEVQKFIPLLALRACAVRVLYRATPIP